MKSFFMIFSFLCYNNFERDVIMWVTTQNKEKVLNCYAFNIVRYYAQKGYKFAIMGEYAHSFWGSVQEVVSLYKTKDDAIKDLEKLNKSLAKGEKTFKF